MRRWVSKLGLGVVALGLVATGCAEERSPINRVQPNALQKSFFVGTDLQDSADDPEFWGQATVVDVGYGASQDGLFTSTYAQPLNRIKWVIQEDLLVGRVTFERIPGSDGKGNGPTSNDGVIAYAFPIISHFDIRRAYNPSTGEEQNVIEENQSDRPWYEREYFRVDWSKNLNTDSYDFDTLSMLGVFGGVTYEPLAYYVNDPAHPDAPHFDENYFDVTNKAFAKPGEIDLSHLGWGINSFPACFLDADILNGTAPAGDCNPVELTLRFSFRKVVDSDYESINWDGYMFQQYGAFTTDRSGYARNYGIVDEKWTRVINRYNIWERSHFYQDPEKMEGAIPCGLPETKLTQETVARIQTEVLPPAFSAARAYLVQQLGTPGDFSTTTATWYALDTTTNVCKGITLSDSKKSQIAVKDVDRVYCGTTPYGATTYPAGTDNSSGSKYGTGANRDQNNNGTDDECEAAGVGSRCDTFAHKCTLPFAQRTVKPVAWYYTNTSNPDYFESTAQAANDWDVAFRAAVMAGKYAECNNAKMLEQVNAYRPEVEAYCNREAVYSAANAKANKIADTFNMATCLSSTDPVKAKVDNGVVASCGGTDARLDPNYTKQTCKGSIDAGKCSSGDAALAQDPICSACAIEKGGAADPTKFDMEGCIGYKESAAKAGGSLFQWCNNGKTDQYYNDVACKPNSETNSADDCATIEADGKWKWASSGQSAECKACKAEWDGLGSDTDRRMFKLEGCLGWKQYENRFKPAESATAQENATFNGFMTACEADFPIYRGQQEENDDAINLVREVDACRHRIGIYANVKDTTKECDPIADEIGAQRGYSAGVIALAKMPEVIVLCHSPVEENDPEACGEKGTIVRMGDLRYHQVNVITAPQTPSPWGIMVDANDPITGETVSASINVWSHVNDLWSQGVVDRLRYIKGELQTEQVTDGTYVDNWVQAEKVTSGNGMLPQMSKDDVNARLAGMAHVDPDKFAAVQKAPDLKAIQMGLETMKKVQDVAASNSAPSQLAAKYEQRRQRAIGTQTEAELMTPAMQQLAGVEKLPMSEAVMKMASPLQGGNWEILHKIKQLKEVALAERGACVMNEAPSPTSLTGLADMIEKKFGAFDPSQSPMQQQERAERIRRYLATGAQYAVIVHEMGHSVGERHNFVSSSDAWNYRPQYWQLRTKNGKFVQDCTDIQHNDPKAEGKTWNDLAAAEQDDAEHCSGARWYDPVTKEERDGLIWVWMASSVMDYAGEYGQDLIGLGAYDFGAARMFYGQAMSVYTDPKYRSENPSGAAAIDKMDSFGGIVGYKYTKDGSFNNIHYSQLQKHHNMITDCKPVQDINAFRPRYWNDARDGAWEPTLDGQIVMVDGQYSRCKTQQVDFVPHRSMIPNSLPTDDFSHKEAARDQLHRSRTPHGFASDNWADLGNLAVYRHDNGADTYELFNFFITEQEVHHIFVDYRRGRQDFSVRNAANRTLERYNTKMRDGAKGLTFYKNIYKNVAADNNADFDDVWPSLVTGDFLKSNFLASSMAFDHFTRQFGRPQAGPHLYAEETYVDAGADSIEVTTESVLRSTDDTNYAGFFVGQETPIRVVVPDGPTGKWDQVGFGGKLIENRLSNNNGDYDSSYTMNAGSYYDKVYATMLLTESVDNFISQSRGDFVDARFRSTSMADLLPDAYRRWLGNNLTGDDFMKAAAWVRTNDKLVPDADKSTGYPTVPMGWMTWSTPKPQICFPDSGTTLCTAGGFTGFGGDEYTPPNAFQVDGVDKNGKPIKLTKFAMPVDPQVGWEQQKFLIAWTLMFLPENNYQGWIDQMSMWTLGADGDPGFADRMEFHDPTGRVYIARDFGTETYLGRTVRKGVAARMLEYANKLLEESYVVDPGGTDADGNVLWWIPRLNANGEPIVKKGPDIVNSDLLTSCSSNLSCVELQKYTAVLAYLRQAMHDFGYASPGTKGVYD